jgi:putative hydrolase of the HAD superfamily
MEYGECRTKHPSAGWHWRPKRRQWKCGFAYTARDQSNGIEISDPIPNSAVNIRTILFDLDDTLNERRASWSKFVEVLRQEYPLPRVSAADDSILETVLAADRGGYRPKEDLFLDLCQRLPWNHAPTPGEIEALWRQRFPTCMVPRDSTHALLADFRSAGLRLGIVTNGRTDMQSQKIHHLELDDLVDAVIISESVGVKKPHPKIFQEAVRALSGTSESTLFVGDHPELDVIGPANVGMQTAWLKLGRDWPAEFKQPDYRLDGLNDLRKILRLNR